MLVPLSWLREYVEFDIEPEKLAERLTMLGMEVQSIERRGEQWRSVVVGELLDVSRHPNAEGLSLTRVRVGDGRKDLSIVCGATNIAVGQRVPVALPGAMLPGERAIGVSRIRGEQSEGMLCSGAELRLSDDADGILILPESSPVGKPLASLYGDVVLDVDVKPNRGDALSLIGIAREVSAITGSPLRWPAIEVAESGDATSDHVALRVEDERLCPRFVARYLDRVQVRPSPLDVQLRLLSAGVRPISNVVDATNYVMLEMGKPTHVFDAKAVAGGEIVVRLAKRGERLETLDHVTRELTPDTLVIADPRKSLAIGGVMGGAESEVSDATTEVIVESAIFDPASIRRTAQRYGLRSEASSRFEKGQEWRLARVGADRVAQLVASWSGARPAQGAVDSNPTEPDRLRLPFRPARVARLLGVHGLPQSEVRQLLTRVGIEFETPTPGLKVPIIAGENPMLWPRFEGEQVLVAVIPTHRRDLVIEADIAEEIARVRGYETIDPQRPNTLMPPYRLDPETFPNRVRDLLAGRGLSEAVSYATLSPADHARLGIGPDDPATIRVANPISQDHSELRRSLLPGLARALATNERQRRSDVAFFELGRTHRFDRAQPVETDELGILLAGNWQPGAWNQRAREADLGDVNGLIEWLANRLHLGTVRFESAEPEQGVEHPGRTARVLVEPAGGNGAVDIGRSFELDPRYVRSLDISAERVAFAELDMSRIESLVPERVTVASLPRTPAVERDVAVIVDRSRSAAEVQAVIRGAAGELLRSISLFDRYEGPSLREDEVSLAYHLRLQAEEQTLTDEAVDELMQHVFRSLEGTLGARIRS